MRLLIPAFTAAAVLLLASPAFAAPTCEDQTGAPMRCATPGAMPVGWTVPPEDRAPDDPTPPVVMLDLIAVVGGIFALIALMPRFDGWRAGDWDRQEGDDDTLR